MSEAEIQKNGNEVTSPTNFIKAIIREDLKTNK